MSVSILCDRVSAGMSRTVAIENARRSSSKRKRETRHFLRLSLNFEYYHTTKRLILSQFCLAKRLAITPRHALLRSDPAWDRWTAPGHPVSGPQRRCSGRTDLDGATEIGWRAGSQTKRWVAHRSPPRKSRAGKSGSSAGGKFNLPKLALMEISQRLAIKTTDLRDESSIKRATRFGSLECP